MCYLEFSNVNTVFEIVLDVFCLILFCWFTKWEEWLQVVPLMDVLRNTTAVLDSQWLFGTYFYVLKLFFLNYIFFPSVSIFKRGNMLCFFDSFGPTVMSDSEAVYKNGVVSRSSDAVFTTWMKSSVQVHFSPLRYTKCSFLNVQLSNLREFKKENYINFLKEAIFYIFAAFKTSYRGVYSTVQKPYTPLQIVWILFSQCVIIYCLSSSKVKYPDLEPWSTPDLI